jgi:hypothetical protein
MGTWGEAFREPPLDRNFENFANIALIVENHFTTVSFASRPFQERI